MIDVQVQLDNIASVNADVWQRVVALDASYLRKRSSTSSYLNPARWNTYLRRRYQLSQNSSPQCPVDRSEYLIIRENLLNQKYVEMCGCDIPFFMLFFNSMMVSFIAMH